MLQIIKGRAGSGKSDKLIDLLKTKAEENREVFLVVPRQYTFESDRNKLKILGNEIGNKITVLSFDRIYDAVTKKYGKPSKKRLSESGRKLVMFCALEKCRGSVEIFKNQLTKESFVDTMLDFCRTMKRQNQSPVDFYDFSKSLQDINFSKKVQELAICADAFEREVEAAGINPDDDLKRLEALLHENHFFKNSVVAFDGFSGFSVAEFEVVKEIFSQAEDIFVSVCCDDIYGDDEFDKFSESAKTARKFIQAAALVNMSVAKPIDMKNPVRFSSKELEQLEKGFLSGNRDTYLNEPHDVYLHCAENIYEEVDFIAREIKKLKRNYGYSFSDFMVVSRNMEEYGNSVYSIFKKYNIPLFYDTRKSICNQPIILAVSALIKIIYRGYRTEDIFSYLKTGLSPLSDDDLFELEKYVYIWKIDGKEAYEQPFIQNPSGYGEKFKEEDKKKLRYLNEVRNRLILHIEKLEEKIAFCPSAKEISAGLFNFIVREGIKDKAEKSAEFYKLKNDLNTAEVIPMVYKSLIDMLEQLTYIFNLKKISLKNYAEYFDMIARLDGLSTIPSGTNEVTLGEAGKIRPTSPKVSFILGANFGDFPREENKNDIFSYREKEILDEHGLPFGVSPIESVAEEYFIAYTALTSPKERLYVSYKNFDKSDSSKAPSLIVSELKRIFKDIRVRSCARDGYEAIESYAVALEEFAGCEDKNSVFSNTLKEALKGYKDVEIEQILNMSSKLEASLSAQQAKKLYSGDLYISPSKVETFYSCPFLYFCRYGLFLKPVEKAGMDKRQQGSLIHYLFEQLLKNNTPKELCEMKEDRLEILINQYFEEYREENLNGEELTHTVEWNFKRILDSTKKLIRGIALDLYENKFTPIAYELSVGDNGDIEPIKLDLSDGSKIKVCGKVDRADIMVQDDKRYLRIVDYKTGRKDFKIQEVFDGINMQMLIYLFSILENGRGSLKNLYPAGILYFPAGIDDNPLITEDKEVEGTRKMKGIILDSPAVVLGMDNTGGGKYITQKLTKKGEINKRSLTATLEEFDVIKDRVTKNITLMGESLKKGCIDVTPYGEEASRPCGYCQFKNICRIENSSDIKKQTAEANWYKQDLTIGESE